MGIDERPEVANNRERIGDWEADTIIGKNHKGAIVTLDERKSKSNTSGKAGGLKTVNRSKRADSLSTQGCKGARVTKTG